MKYGKISLFSLLILFSAAMCLPGVNAKYVMQAKPMTFGLETKTSVEVKFHCVEIGTELPRDPSTDVWEYDGTEQQAKTRIILGDTYYGHEKYAEGLNTIPEPVRADGFFKGWTAKNAPGFLVAPDKDVMFTGEYVLLVPVFENIMLHMTDARGHIPEPGEWDYWEGSGQTAATPFSSEEKIVNRRLPDLKGLDSEMDFAGWFYMNDAGEEVQIVIGKTILEKHDYDVYAKWTPKTNGLLNISDSVV